jgi:hypothetical protein
MNNSAPSVTGFDWHDVNVHINARY